MTDKTPHKIALIPGDLHGETVTSSAANVAARLGNLLTRPIQHTVHNFNADYFLREDIKKLGDEELSTLSKYDSIFLGAVGDPTKIKPGVLEVGILLELRQKFDQYVNYRPIKLPEGVPSILVGKTHEDINFHIHRENSEGLYIGKGHIENEGTDDEVATQEMECSYRAIKRLMNFAIGMARKESRFDRPRIDTVFKTNILTYVAGPWNRVREEAVAANPDIDFGYIHIDAFGAKMVKKPEELDHIITENMFGDITTDLGAELQGGIGSAVSGNINPTREFPSMFEPIHGTAPDKWYVTDSNGDYLPNIMVARAVFEAIKPEGAILAYAMMLEHLKEDRAAEVMKNAALENMRDPDYDKMSTQDLEVKARRFVSRVAA